MLLQKSDRLKFGIDSLLNDLHTIPIYHTDSLRLELMRSMNLLKDTLSAYDNSVTYKDIKRRLDSTERILDWYYLMQKELSLARSHVQTFKTEYLECDIADSTFKKTMAEEELIMENIREKLDSGLQYLDYK